MKRKFLVRLSAFLLIVMILAASVGDAFISVNDISVSHAVGPAVLGYDILYEICRYFGSMYLGYSATREMPEVNIHDDDVARIGYQVIKAEIEQGWYDFIPGMGVIRQDAAIMGVIIENQQYVFGTEALKQVAETEFTVIQGGKNGGDGDDDDDGDEEDNVIHFPKKIGDTAKKWFALTATGAAAFAEFVSNEYQKWLNGDSDSILAEFWQNHNDTFSDYESIRGVDGTYQISGYSYEDQHTYDKKFYDSYYTGSSVLKPFGYLDSSDTIWFCSYTGDGVHHSYNSLKLNKVSYWNGVIKSNSTSYAIPSSAVSYSLNIPIFTSYESAYAAFSSNDFSSALNYAKTYRIADWLQDDWSGTLLDPLTGLNALSNWYNMARHQGLNALGDEATADDMADWIRDYFAQLGTDTLPEVDPSQAPVKFPETVEDVVFDPTSNPAVYPASNPNPGTGDNPGTDSGGDNKPGTGSDTDVDMDEKDYKVDLRGIFPFCIPFDFVALLNVLDADPVAPRFDIPVVIPALEYRKDVTLDMSVFDDVAKVIRICEKVSFVIFLMFSTSKVIRW